MRREERSLTAFRDDKGNRFGMTIKDYEDILAARRIFMA